MLTDTIERYAHELHDRLCTGALAGLGPVTIRRGTRLDFEEAVSTTLAELECLGDRHRRGAWTDLEHENQVWSDIAHLHWMAQLRDTQR
jgi:hypothetical protein